MKWDEIEFAATITLMLVSSALWGAVIAIHAGWWTP